MTLVEMLVVLAIIGVAAGATVLGIGSATRGGSVAAEANRLADRLRLAADEVMVSDRQLAFVADPDGYSFVAWDSRGWHAEDSDSFARHELAGGIRLVGASPAPQLVGVDGSGAPINVRLASSAGDWIVAYDGVSVAAAPVALP
jgi:general secretion pathway protein H